MVQTAYYIASIDFGWDYLPSVHGFAERLAKNDLEIRLGSQPVSSLRLDRFLADFAEAQRLAIGQGWEGDFRGDPSVFCIPVENEISYGFVWKQNNNGDTLVVTPKPMAWLDPLVLR